MFPVDHFTFDDANARRGEKLENRTAESKKPFKKIQRQRDVNDLTKEVIQKLIDTPKEKVKLNSLQRILDNLNTGNFNDIQDYSCGHLNESKLYQPSAFNQKYDSKWKTSRVLRHVAASSVPAKRDGVQETAMKTSLRYFSVDLPNVRPPPTQKKSREKTSSPRSSKTQWIDDRVLVEELQPKTPVVQFRDADEDYKRRITLHSYMPIHLNGVTKKDQLHQLRRYQRDVIKKQDSEEQHVLTGLKVVEDLEAELQLALEMLQQTGCGPNFHRLQVYSNIFQRLIDRSPTFSCILQKIKTKYDDYVACLLDKPMVQRQVLMGQMKDVTGNISCNMQQLQAEMDDLRTLETEAKSVLEENDRLRQLYRLKEEAQSSSGQQTTPLIFKDMIASDEEASSVKTTPMSEKATPEEEEEDDLADKVEQLHSAIWQRLSAISDLRQNLNTNFVPISVCSHLQQCVKDTEMELQKLNAQKDYIEKNSKSLKEQLIQDIENADTTEKDARQIWKKINADVEDDDDLYDEERKWSWYIS